MYCVTSLNITEGLTLVLRDFKGLTDMNAALFSNIRGLKCTESEIEKNVCHIIVRSFPLHDKSTHFMY